jgi:hypothetical protein
LIKQSKIFYLFSRLINPSNFAVEKAIQQRIVEVVFYQTSKTNLTIGIKFEFEKKSPSPFLYLLFLNDSWKKKIRSSVS